jgi:hypothetical protein
MLTPWIRSRFLRFASEADHVFCRQPPFQTTGSPREVDSSSNAKQNEYSHGSDAKEQCERTWSHTDPEISRSVSDDRDDDTSRVIGKSNVADAAIVGGIFDTVKTKSD